MAPPKQKLLIIFSRKFPGMRIFETNFPLPKIGNNLRSRLVNEIQRLGQISSVYGELVGQINTLDPDPNDPEPKTNAMALALDNQELAGGGTRANIRQWNRLQPQIIAIFKKYFGNMEVTTTESWHPWKEEFEQEG